MAESVGMIPSFVRLCGQGAPVASVGLYLAPMPTIRQIASSGTVGGLPLLPYTSMTSNAFIWMVYGFMKKESKVWSCNAVGVALGLYYCLQFVRNIPKAKQTSILDISTPTLPGSVKQHVQGVTAVVLGILSLALFKPFAANTVNMVGTIGIVICCIMFASPLSVMKVVLETKSAKSIPLPLAIVSCLNCFMWVVYGWFAMKDFNVYFPNLLGLLSGIFQVILKLIFGDNDNVPMHSGADIAP